MDFLENKLTDAEVNSSCPGAKDYLFQKGRLSDFLDILKAEVKELKKDVSAINKFNMQEKQENLLERIERLEFETKTISGKLEVLNSIHKDVEKLKEYDRDNAVTTASNKAKIVLTTSFWLSIISGIGVLIFKKLT